MWLATVSYSVDPRSHSMNLAFCLSLWNPWSRMDQGWSTEWPGSHREPPWSGKKKQSQTILCGWWRRLSMLLTMSKSKPSITLAPALSPSQWFSILGKTVSDAPETAKPFKSNFFQVYCISVNDCFWAATARKEDVLAVRDRKKYSTWFLLSGWIADH